MDTTLLFITVLSVVVAVYAWVASRRLQRREQERAAARAAALSAAADAPIEGWMQVGGEWQWNPAPHAIGAEPVTEPVTSPESLHPDTGSVRVSSDRLFGTVAREAPPVSRLPLFAAAALIVLLGGALIFLNTSATNEHASTVAQVSHTEPLELVSLGHARNARTLTITGTVRNPSSGLKLEGLTAVVTLLDNAGTLVSTKDVPLDYRALGPGEEAPFKVSIPDAGSISRYRVSFRAGTDVVPHVDRRGDIKLASALQ